MSSRNAFAAGVAVLGVAPGADARAVAASLGARVKTAEPLLHAVEVVAPPAVLRRIATRVGRDPALRYVEPLEPIHLDHARNDPATTVLDQQTGQPYEWAFKAVHVDRALNLSQGSPDILVGVVDSGYWDVPDLRGKVAKAWYFPAESSDALDTEGHGTFVASLIAAGNDDGVGLAGFCGACKLDVFKLVALNQMAVAQAIRQLVDDHVRIINLSLGSDVASYALYDAVNYASTNGVLVVASTGNDGSGQVSYPAAWLAGDNGALGYGLAVGASDFNTNRAFFSQWGSRLSIVAPGALDSSRCSVGIWAALPPVSTDFDSGRGCDKTFTDAIGNRYAYSSGTSFSAPEVAGIAALVWAARPELKNFEVVDILQQTATRAVGTGWQPDRGWGVVDAAAAVERATGRSSADVVQVTGASAEELGVPGRRLTVSATVRWGDGSNVSEGQIACNGAVGVRPLPTVAGSLSGGTGTCTWRLPVRASGKTIAGTIAATDADGNSGFARFAIHVRRAKARR